MTSSFGEAITSAGSEPLVAVVLCEGVEQDADQLRASIAGQFASWQLPERWAFVDEVPKTSVGKFDKKVLRRRHADGELVVVELASAVRPRD